MSLLLRHAGGATPLRRIVQVAAFGLHAVPLAFTYFRLRWEGVENVPADGPAVIAPNHTSIIDPVVAIVPIYLAQRGRMIQYVGARDQVYGPYGPYIRFFSSIPLEKGKADWRAYRSILAALGEGRLIGVFPEGGVTRDGRPLPFHPGAAWIALQAGVPLVPVTINGTFDLWPRQRRLPRPGRVEILFHPPIRCGEMADRRHDPAAVEEVRARLEAAALGRYRGPGGGGQPG